MKYMNGFEIFEKMTGVNEKFISEAAEMPNPELAVVKISPWKRFSHFMNSGIGVALICGIVAVGVTLGVLMMGWNADPVSPSSNPGVSTNPETNSTDKTFAFSYELSPVKDYYEPGDTLTVTTEVENLGKSFTVKGSSQAFHASAWLIPHGESDVNNAEGKINGSFAIREDYMTQTIKTGDIGRLKGSIFLPEDASGVYDLVLSYENEYQVFENAIRVDTAIPTPQEITFHCMDTPRENAYAPGDSLDLNIAIMGVDSLQISTSGDIAPLYAKLIPHGASDETNAIEVEGVLETAEPDANNPDLSILNFTLPITLPQDTPRGWYDLHLAWAGESAVFRQQLHVTEENFRFTCEISESANPDAKYTYNVGDTFSISATIENLGKPFEITGHGLAFSPTITLKHKYHSYELEVVCAYPDNILTRTVETGEIGRIQGYVHIPEDATGGAYYVYLSYGDTVVKMENRISVTSPEEPPAEPITEEEAIEIANQYMANRNIPIPLERMQLYTSHYSGEYFISYIYYLDKFSTSYKFSMAVGYDRHIYDYKHTVWDPEAYYATYTEDEVAQARERLVAKISADFGDRFTGMQWSGSLKEKDGKLYLRAEVIIDCEHGHGCNFIDCLGHEHHFYEEEVTKITP